MNDKILRALARAQLVHLDGFRSTFVSQIDSAMKMYDNPAIPEEMSAAMREQFEPMLNAMRRQVDDAETASRELREALEEGAALEAAPLAGVETISYRIPDEMIVLLQVLAKAISDATGAAPADVMLSVAASHPELLNGVPEDGRWAGLVRVLSFLPIDALRAAADLRQSEERRDTPGPEVLN